MKILELYSGIGGMHWSLKASGVKGKIQTSIDINPIANKIYRHNFPEVNLLHRNIQGLTPKIINNFDVDTILMSPPCQPFTRNGRRADVNDERTNSFKHILGLLPELNIKNILIENVKGFEVSLMRDLLIETLDKCQFIHQEFLLSPNQLGVPNSRLRYYCLAKKSPGTFNFPVERHIRHELPTQQNTEQLKIADILETGDPSSYSLPDKILTKYLNILDIVTADSTASCCFTKAYGRYIEGTGSIFTDRSSAAIDSTFKEIAQSENSLELARSLNLRFFTPREVCRLMNFPEEFAFPPEITDRQKYMVLGNSVNVKIVSELIKLL